MHRFHPTEYDSHATAHKPHGVKILILGNVTDEIKFNEKWDYYRKSNCCPRITEIIAVDIDPVYENAENLAKRLNVLFIFFKGGQYNIRDLLEYADTVFICVDEQYHAKEQIEQMQREGKHAIVVSEVIPV